MGELFLPPWERSPAAWIVVFLATIGTRLWASHSRPGRYQVLPWMPAGIVVFWVLQSGELESATRLAGAMTLSALARQPMRGLPAHRSIAQVIGILCAALGLAWATETSQLVLPVVAGFALAEGYGRILALPGYGPIHRLGPTGRTLLVLTLTQDAFLLFAAAGLVPEREEGDADRPLRSGIAIVATSLAVLTARWTSLSDPLPILSLLLLLALLPVRWLQKANG